MNSTVIFIFFYEIQETNAKDKLNDTLNNEKYLEKVQQT